MGKKAICIGADQGCRWETVGQNVCLHLPLLSSRLRGRASHAQIHTADAAQFYKCARTSRLEFGAVCGNWRALFHVHILHF